MAVDAKTRKKRIIQIAAGIIMVLVLGGAALFLFSGGEEEVAPNNLGPSDSMVPGNPADVQVSDNAEILVNPMGITFMDGQTMQVMTITATGGPVILEDARIPSEFSSAVKLSSTTCPKTPEPLQASASCDVNVEWDGVTQLSTAIEVIGSTLSMNGQGRPLKTMVALTAQPSAGAPGVTGVNGLPTQPGGFEDSTSGQVPGAYAGNGQAGGQSNGNYAPQPAVQQQPAQPSLRQQQRDAYLTARRQGTLTGIGGGQVTATAKSAYTSWNNIGAQGSVSSFPTDMSRVITPDKAITAVISVPIDTRNPVTAVAMVDRDVYGNNGRTVVIPRGSKLIGTAGVSDSRVGVAWKQLIRPDGTRFVFEAASGDAMGRGGIPGRVNERNLERYGFSLLPTLAGAAITTALGGQSSESSGINGSTQTRDARAVAAEIISEPLNKIAQDIYAKKSNIPVQIVVPAGTRITVWAINDLRLKPMGEAETDSRQSQDQKQGNRTSNRQDVNMPTQAANQNGGNQSSQGNNNNNNGPEGDENLGNYAVGRIDENGNYVAPGARAPAPSTAPLNRK